jgi:hypothetical protein
VDQQAVLAVVLTKEIQVMQELLIKDAQAVMVEVLMRMAAAAAVARGL